MSCEQCQQFCDRQRINDASFYREVVRQLVDLVSGGALEVITGTCSLESLLKSDDPWPADVIEHQLQCMKGGQRFSLAVETYHGSGGSWEPSQ